MNKQSYSVLKDITELKLLAYTTIYSLDIAKNLNNKQAGQELKELMGSDMCQRNLKNVLQLLVAFEKAPKEIKGRLIAEWFKVGESLFEEFHSLGINSAWNLSPIRSKTEVQEVVQRVTKNQDWLQSFVTIYPNLRLDLDGAHSAAAICKVRSGLQFLLKGFKGTSASFDKVLQDLEDLGEVDEFDSQLKVWVETGHRPEFFPGDKHSNIPTSHWWWF